MTPSDHAGYVPFLKGKRGEFRALAQLNFEQRQMLAPLIDVPPEKVEFFPDEVFQIDTVDQALDGYAAKVAETWGQLDTCFVDLAGFDPALRMADGRHPLTAFFADARAADLAAVPVTGPSRDAAQLEAVEQIVEVWRLGAAVRLHRPELSEPEHLAERLARLLRIIGQQPSQVDLLLDFGELLKSEAGAIEAQARAAILALPDVQDWRSLVLCTGAYPEAVRIETNSSGELPRHDWMLWRRLISATDDLPRIPTFGDYGVSAADWGDPYNPLVMTPACKIIYATEEDWVMVKGSSVENGYEQYRDLAAQVKARGEFLTKDHCQGEEKIIECAAGRGGVGNLETWVTVATRRHIEVVSRQLTSLPA